MRILAIDTSAGTSVALVNESGNALAEFESSDIMRHAETIGTGIANVLAAASVSAEMVDAVAVGRGPAPFTGLRVGLAAAVMFGIGRGIPVYGVVSHDAIALAELSGKDAGDQPHLLVLTDARRKEVYWSLYSSRLSGTTSGEQLVRLEGPGVQGLGALETSFTDQRVSYRQASAPCTAANLARVLLAQLAAGSASQDVSPLYLRAPDAVPPKPKQVSG